jgi:ubiquitin carboxyl-terminal hydrolase 4/11/15
VIGPSDPVRRVLELHGSPSVTTASTSKKRKIAGQQTEGAARDDGPTHSQSPHEAAAVASPRSSPRLSASRSSASPPPPRYLPPHLHDEVLPETDAGSTSRDYNGASSPSEAYAHLTLDSRAPRSSSPAKRPHSDMADDMADDMDLDGPSKSPPGESQRSTRATSVDMVDADLPSLDQQVAKVMSMASAPLQERQEGYIVSHKWLARVWARTSEYSDRPQEFSKEATQGPIGPVDNSGLVDADALGDDLMDQGGEDFIPLSKALLLSHDYEILPAKAWELINNWYGLKEGTPVIRRYAHNTVPDKSSEQIAYELHPPVLTIRKVRRAPASATETARPAVKIVGSRYESFLAFLEAAKKAAGIDLKNKVRIWRLLNSAPTDVPTQPSGMLTPDASPRDGSPVATLPPRASLVMDVASFNSLANGIASLVSQLAEPSLTMLPGIERELVTGKDEKANEDSNESLTLEGASLTQDQIIILEEHDEQGEYISDTVKAAPKESSGVQVSKSSQSTPNSGRSTPVGGVSTRSRARNGKVRGHVGLVNLGNTCYMNSALQCLRSVEELSMYFLSNKWKNEINHNNPIGNKGAVAKVYGSLLHSIYDVSAVSSFAPRNFKSVLSKANTLFSGYGQQDSQEFVSWLIDALHEDLNRVHEKPYRENPDSDDNTFRDPEAIKRLGQVYQANHKARNNSVAMDLFSGKRLRSPRSSFLRRSKGR